MLSSTFMLMTEVMNSIHLSIGWRIIEVYKFANLDNLNPRILQMK